MGAWSRRGAWAAAAAVAVLVLATGASAAQFGLRTIPSGAPGDQTSPALAFDGSNYLVAWQDEQATALFDIFGARVSPGGILVDQDAFGISRAPGAQRYPSLAFGADTYLVDWTDERNGSFAAYGARIAPSGQVLDPAGIWIEDDGSFARVFPRGLAFDGSSFILPWWWARIFSPFDEAIEAIRVTPGGARLPPPTTISQGGSAPDFRRLPAIAFGDSSSLVAWYDQRAGDTDVYGARVTPDMEVLDSHGIPIATGPGDQEAPAIAFGAGEFLTVWQGQQMDAHDLFGSRVAQDGSVLDPDGFPIDAGFQGDAAVAFDGTNFLVAWSKPYAGGDVYCARVAPDGTVLDMPGIPVAVAPGDQRSVQLAFDGTNYLLVWQDDRGGDWDVYGARVTPSAEVLDPGGFLITHTPIVPPPPPPPGSPPPPPPSMRCVVPRVVGRTLSAARARIRHAHCAIGRIRRVRARKQAWSRVVAQSPRAGSIRARGYPVRLAVGRR